LAGGDEQNGNDDDEHHSSKTTATATVYPSTHSSSCFCWFSMFVWFCQMNKEDQQEQVTSDSNNLLFKSWQGLKGGSVSPSAPIIIFEWKKCPFGGDRIRPTSCGTDSIQ
jgi:hypothetical protein